jgi:hypothetical protein
MVLPMLRLLLRSALLASPLFLVLACSTDDSPEPRGGNGGNGAASGAGGASGGSSGTTAGMPSSGGASGQTGAGGTTGGSAGTSSGTGGTNSGGTGGSGASGQAGTGAASGGGAGAPAAGTSGSAGTGTVAGQGGTAGEGAGGSAGTAAGGMGAAGAPATCPTNVLFCSGFEDAGLPTGATYLSSNDNNDPSQGLAFDDTVFHGGMQSVQVLKITSYAQREIVVPAAQVFWFRAYLRTDVEIGGPEGTMHNLFFEAAYPNGDKGVEIVEEDCMLGMNIQDSRYGSNGTVNQPGCPSAEPLGTQLEANTWHCIEGFFDGVKGDVRLFANGTEVLTQTNLAGAKQAYSTLRFGYRHYHERQRLVWYDDVATAPDRVGCLP